MALRGDGGQQYTIMDNNETKITAGADAAPGKKYKLSEIIAAFKNHDVELDTSDVICYVTDKAAGSLCDFDKLDMRHADDFRKFLCHSGLNTIACEAMSGEPEAVGMLAEASAREMKRKDAAGLLKALIGAGKD